MSAFFDFCRLWPPGIPIVLPEGKSTLNKTVFFASTFWLFATLADRERAARDKMKVGKKWRRKDQSGTAGHWGSFNQVILQQNGKI